MSSEPPLQLDYATVRSNSWGSLFIRPSRLTLLFLAILALSIFWLARRHDPWRLTATVLYNGNYADSPLITPEHRLLCEEIATGLTTVDLNTGQLITTIVPASDKSKHHYIPLGNGDRLLDAGGVGRTMPIYSTSTGKVIAQLPNPAFLNPAYRFHDISPDTTRLVTENANQDSNVLNPEFLLWDLSSNVPLEQMKPIKEIRARTVRFANEGKRIVASLDDHMVAVLDAQSLKSLSLDGCSLPQSIGADSKRGYLVFYQMNSKAANHLPTSLRSTWDDRLLATYQPPPGPGFFTASWSLDFKTLYARFLRRSGSPAKSDSIQLDVLDAASNRLLKRINYTIDNSLLFFPDDHRYVVSTRSNAPGETPLELYDLDHQHPLAIIHPPPGTRLSRNSFRIAATGDTIFAWPEQSFPGVPNLMIYHPTGWDCPESSLGLLAFPATWLIIVSLVAAACLLFRDARRKHDPSGALSPLLLYPLFTLSLALTLHSTLEACHGVYIRSPAPLLLIATIGLATGSRAWRTLSLILLALTLAWCCYCLTLLRQTQTDAFPFFDRVYTLPHAIRLSALTATTLAIIAAIVILVLPKRRISQL